MYTYTLLMPSSSHTSVSGVKQCIIGLFIIIVVLVKGGASVLCTILATWCNDDSMHDNTAQYNHSEWTPLYSGLHCSILVLFFLYNRNIRTLDIAIQYRDFTVCVHD